MEQNIKKLQDKAKSYWSLFEKLNTASSIAVSKTGKLASYQKILNSSSVN